MKLPDQEGFVRIAKALGPYLDQLVIVGAWCHRLLHFHTLATPPSYTPLMTEDADVATPERLPARAPSIAAALTAGGFRPSLMGSDRLPVMKYYPGDDDKGLYVEFIAPLRGSGYTRSGEPDDILAIAGITAQKLRHVDLLLFEPWQLELAEQHGFDVGSDQIVLRVANPASYLAQKVLTLRKRQSPAKKSKDALYIHDAVTMFGSELTELREQGARVLQLLPPKTQDELQAQRVEIFRDAALMIRAADIAAATGRANPPSPATIRNVCTLGLERIFAP
jgi:hypothetical protein